MTCGAGGVGNDGFSVETKAGGAVNVSAIGAYMCCLQLFENLLAGMAVAVAKPQEMTAHCGATRARNSGRVDVMLP